MWWFAFGVKLWRLQVAPTEDPKFGTQERREEGEMDEVRPRQFEGMRTRSRQNGWM